ncbi:multidrug ABC transporter permease [Aeromonas hydrophila AD9]|nr:multidrug ABC transporter permease [Aeromonas hydrophila AD9]
MNSLRRLWVITQKALRQLARDRFTTLGMVVMSPVEVNR